MSCRSQSLPSERDLSATLEVSRETVRGAVQTLAAVGMLEISQGARTRVSRTEGYPSVTGTPDPDKIGRYSADEVFKARKLVELTVIRDADRARRHRAAAPPGRGAG